MCKLKFEAVILISPSGLCAFVYSKPKGNSKVIKEFRDFIMRGNVLDLAVGVIIGAAFGAIVNSLVNNILMPIISLLTRGINFDNLFIPLDGKSYATLKAAQDAGAAVIGYGTFITALLNFVIIAFVIFMIVRAVNSMTKEKAAEAPAAPPAPTKEEVLLAEIRDLLAKQVR
jgi:large conductance mechanosensitive channel